MTKKEAFDIGLPKWPQMRVIGEQVPVELAEEIILRTDNFFGPFSGGNNHNFDKALRKLFIGYEECPNNWRERSDIYDRQEAIHKNLETETDKEKIKILEDMLDQCKKKLEEFLNSENAYYQAFEDFNLKVGRIDTEYVGNSWFSCPFIGGPHGWMHPDGTIGYADNVGKWPSVRTIYNDWKKIGKAFSQLNLKVTLMSGESCEDCTHPLVTMELKNGKIKITENHIDNSVVINQGRKPGSDLLEMSQKFGRIDDTRENFYSLKYIANRFVPLAQKKIKEFDEKAGEK